MSGKLATISIRKSRLLLLLLLSFISSSESQIISFGKCPKVKIMEEFEIDEFLGIWYLVQKYPFWLTVGSSCTSIVVDTIGEENTVTGEVLQRKFGSQTSTLIVSKTTKAGFRTLKIPGLGFLPQFEWNVLYTDYDNIAVVYSCKNLFGLAHAKHVWIFSRSRFHYEHVMFKAHDVLRQNNISTIFIVDADHTNCPEIIRKRLLI